MSFIKLSRKPKETASSDPPAEEQGSESRQKVKVPSQRNLQFDLFAHLSYMASVATGGVTRSELFEYASELPYASSKYFKDIHTLARKMNTDYAESCTIVAERSRDGQVRSLLLRMAGSLASGEHESDFLRREAEIIGETYGNQYERDVEALKKWTDAYVTLLVASGLIVIVAVISMMIYSIGVALIIGLSVLMVFSTVLGAWILYASAPREIKTRVSGASSRLQILGGQLFRISAPMAMMVASIAVLMGIELGYILILGGFMLFPAGYVINKDDKNIAKKDADISTVVRVLGGVTSAIGTTLTAALSSVDKRSMGALAPEVTVLRQRLMAGINPDLCWRQLVNETGSELIDRTVEMFYKAISMGAEASAAGSASAFYSSKIAFLRAKRSMTAATFTWLIFPLHIAMVGLLVFIVEIMHLFTRSVAESQEQLSQSSTLQNQFATGELFTFGQIDLQLVNVLVTSVVLVLTIVNAVAPKAADGGNNLKIVYNGAIMMVITGGLMVGVPAFARSIFASIVAT